MGAAVGAVVGGLAGKATAEAIDPTAEEAYWTENYVREPYYEKGLGYDQYAPAYRTGYEGRRSTLDAPSRMWSVTWKRITPKPRVIPACTGTKPGPLLTPPGTAIATGNYLGGQATLARRGLKPTDWNREETPAVSSFPFEFTRKTTWKHLWWRVVRPSSLKQYRPEAHSSGMSWGAVLGGAFVAAALALILLLLGTGLGLTVVSPWANEGASAKTLGIAAIAWMIITHFASSALGGYMAGRLRTKWVDFRTDEVFFRDTAHGLVAWAVGIVLTAAFLTSAVTSVVGGAAKLGATSAAATAGARSGCGRDGAGERSWSRRERLFRRLDASYRSSTSCG